MIRRPAALDSLASLFASGLGFLLSIPTSILIARALGPAGKGLITLTQAIVAQGIIFSLGVEVSLIYAAGRSPSDLRSLAGAAIRIALVVGPLGALAGIALLRFGFPEVGTDSTRFWMVLSMTAIPVLLLGGYLQSLVIATGRLTEIAVLSALRSLLMLIAAATVMFTGWGVTGFLSLNLATVALVGILTAMLGYRYGILPPTSPELSATRNLISYGIRGHVGTVLHGLNNRLDFFLVGMLLAPAALGRYSVAVAAAEMLLLIPTFVGTLILQRASADTPEEATRFTSLATRVTSLALLLGGVVLVLVGHWVIAIMFGPTFASAVTPLRWLIPGIWALGLWRNLTNDLMGRGYPIYRTVSAGCAAIVTIVLDFLLVPRLGIEGAAVASSVAYASALLVAFHPYMRVTGEPWTNILLPQRSDWRRMREALRASFRYMRASRGPELESGVFYQPSE